MAAVDVQIHDKLKTEIKTIILGALKTVAREQCPRGFRTNNDDVSQFLEMIRIEQIECVSEHFMPGPVNVEENNLPNEHQFPGHPSRRECKGYTVHGEGTAGISLNPGIVRPVTGGVGAHADFDVYNERSLVEEPVPLPANAGMEHRQYGVIHSHKIRLSVQADFKIRVYCAKPVKIGAAAGGGTGAVVGAAGGATGGAAVGALVGSVVPVAGTIVGGVIGGIVGGIGGFIGGGAAAAGVGAGVGAAHSNNVYKTVQAYEVFNKLPEFSEDRTNNTCSCTITGNTTCPYQQRRLSGNRV